MRIEVDEIPTWDSQSSGTQTLKTQGNVLGRRLELTELYLTTSSPCIAINAGLRAGRSGFSGTIPSGGWEFFSSPPRPERLWGPPSLLSNGYQVLFPWGYSGRVVKLTTHLHLVPRSKNEWSYTSTPQYTFIRWCSDKAQGWLYIYFTL
jgi:hypothetical protein